MVRGMLGTLSPAVQVTITNRGMGGDRTAELLPRWKPTARIFKPDVLSIKIGVNDVWRLAGAWNAQKHIPLNEFRANYARLLEQSKAAGVRNSC